MAKSSRTTRPKKAGSPLVAQLFATGIGHHQAGQLPQAEASYRRALTIDPKHAPSSHYLGVLAYQRGDHQDAVDLIGRAIALDGADPESHYNITLPLQALGRTDDVIAHCRRAIALKSDHARAHINLGLALMTQGHVADAVVHFQKSVAHDPGLAEGYINLASALLRYGKLYDALGVINRGFEIGVMESKAEQGLALVRQAIEIEESADTRTLFVQCVRTLKSVPDRDDVRALMLRAVTEPWGRPADLAPAAASLIRRNDALRDAIERAARAWPRRLPADELFGSAGLAAVVQDRLLRGLLESTSIRDIALERFLTNVRVALLDAAEQVWNADFLAFGCALARHCFINEYAFDCTEAEVARVDKLRDALVAAAQAGESIPASCLVTVAAYMPLHSLPAAELFPQKDWPAAVTALLDQQVRAPREEQRLRASIPALTAIADDVSLLVQQQYEQNPYPRWVKTAPVGAPTRLDDYLGAKFPDAGFRPLGKSATDVLIAGCGTGQHSATVALQFLGTQILAVDLSMASLCYASRTTRALGLTGIAYAQADILKLGSIDRRFDLIDASGVLHHLADPFAGWRVLLTLLRPGGVMRLGLYSTLGRREIEAVRRFVTERGYQATAHDIRRCRQELMGFADATPQKAVTETSDFYSLSECRDLLFHVQERNLTLPEIRNFLAANALRFLGFETTASARQHYARRFPGDAAMTDLDRWKAIETEAPRTFFNMYQFWIQKPA